jgi:hypothetical protein
MTPNRTRALRALLDTARVAAGLACWRLGDRIIGQRQLRWAADLRAGRVTPPPDYERSTW